MSKMTGKPYPQPPQITQDEMHARFKRAVPAASPAKGIVEAVKDATAKMLKRRK